MRTPIPICVDGLYGLKAEQVLSGRISLSDLGLLAELSLVNHSWNDGSAPLSGLQFHTPGSIVFGALG